MIKKISLAIILLVLLCFQSIAIEKPKINNLKERIHVGHTGTSFSYNRNSSKNESFLDKYKKNVKILLNNLSILIYDRKDSVPAIYIMNNSISIGYCLLETVEFQDNLNNTLLLEPIKELKKDENYLKNDLKRFRGLEVVFYFNEKNNFVERYAFLKISNQKSRNILLMEAFYPKSLENEIKPYIIDKLNKDLYLRSVDPLGNTIDNGGKDKSKDKNSGSRDDDKKIGK